jgi:hypothetical protein
MARLDVDIKGIDIVQRIRASNLFEILANPAVRAMIAFDEFRRFTDRVKCIFHDDPNPSLRLYPNGYYCFGCKAKGDIIDLIQKITGLDFNSTLALLANSLSDELVEVADEDYTEIYNAQLTSLVDAGPREERYVWWCGMLNDKPRGKWQFIPDNDDAKQWAISQGAGFFSVLSVDRIQLPCWYFGPWYIDLDGPGARDDLSKLREKYEGKGLRAWDTGKKGYHVLIDTDGNGPLLPLQYQGMTLELMSELGLTSPDMGVYNLGRGRVWRIEGIIRPNGNRKTRII